jgi:hypothetical protein
MTHGQEYKVAVFNHDSTRKINAIIEIDGKNIGSFRVERNGNICVERPSCDGKERKLTFFAVGSAEARSGKIEACNLLLGTMIVTIECELSDDDKQRAIEKVRKLHMDKEYENEMYMRRFVDEMQRRRLRKEAAAAAAAAQTPSKNTTTKTATAAVAVENHYECMDPIYQDIETDDDGYLIPNRVREVENRSSQADCCGGTALGADSAQRFAPAPKITTSEDKIVLIAKLILKREPRVIPL